MRYQDELDGAILRQYAADLNYRARQLEATGEVSPDDLRARILESAGHCEWCGRSLVKLDFEIDHIQSLSKGGANTISNLAVSCADCNRRKGEKSPIRFAKERVASTGNKTALILRLLTMYDETAHVQNMLFEGDDVQSQSQDEQNTDPEDWTYRW